MSSDPRPYPQSPPLERSLDQMIERLLRSEQTPRVRALLVEARRLRSTVASWRSIPPPPEVRAEMLARVLRIASEEPSTSSENVQVMPVAAPLATKSEPPMRSRAEMTLVTGMITTVSHTPIQVHHQKLPDEIDPRLVMLRDPYSERADAYRALRHRLTTSGDPRVIAVTSAERGEGKTTCAINLALALCESTRERVLLVEANLRTPAIASMLAFAPPECFSRQLARHRDDPQTPWLAVEQVPSLHILAVDPIGEYAPVLDPVAFAMAIDRFRLSGFDHIVIDTPPVLESADVNVIAENVDSLLLTGWAQKSKGRTLKRALDKLRPTPVLGLVLLDA